MNQLKHPVFIIPLVFIILSGFALLLAASSENTVSAQTVEVTPTPDNSLARVQEAGKLVVGVSVPYAPFAYRTGLFQVDGFDIALMREIAQRLNLEVEFKDYAFEGLFGALQLNKLDLAIAAITVTPNRAKLVDFSEPYYQGAGAAVTSADSPITSITSAASLAGLRIGVQRGTVYETWLRQNFIRTGVGTSASIYTYKDLGPAIADLQRDRLDVALMDLPVAENYVRQGGVKLVALTEPTQDFAIALPKGAASLKMQIDLTLEQINQDGTLAQLLQVYGLTPPPPVPEPTCLNDLTYVADITYNDQNMTAPPALAPNEPFVKTWRVRNSGTCGWDTTYRLVFSYGNSPYAQMGGQPTNVTQAVAPGQEYDLSINLVAPPFPGVYQGFWQMQTGQGQAFGEKIYVGISVPAAPMPTPAPTQTPAPGINFSVDNTSIEEGECVTFTWDVVNVKEVYFYADDEDWQDHGVAGQGSSVQCPDQTTTYNLRVVKQDGTVETRQITIFVEVTEEAPDIDRFTLEPSQITVGECTNIRWDVSGEVDTVRILSNNQPIWDGAPLQGNINDCPPGAGIIVYAIEANGPGGSSREESSLTVTQPSVVVPTPVPPTPAPSDPVIQAFTVTPGQLKLGECVVLVWEYSGQDVVQAAIQANGENILPNPPPTGTANHCPGEPGQWLYRLGIASASGGRATEEALVIVQPN